MSLIPNVQKKPEPVEEPETSFWDYAAMIGIPVLVGAATGGIGGLALSKLGMTAAGVTAGQAAAAGSVMGGISGAGAGTLQAIAHETKLPMARGSAGGADPLALLYSPQRKSNDALPVESSHAYFFGGPAQGEMYQPDWGDSFPYMADAPSTYELQVSAPTMTSFEPFGGFGISQLPSLADIPGLGQ